MQRHIAILCLALLVPFLSFGYWLPEVSTTLVNDYSSILTPSQNDSLERRLVQFNQQTSNQIVVIITPTLEGEEIISAGQRVAQVWGIGQKEYNNGLLIIIKSKTADEPYGDVAILTGYGFEGAFPDVFCSHIIDQQMIPHLAENDYYGAICDALDVILPVAAGEYSYEQAMGNDDMTDFWIGLTLFLIFGAFVALLYYIDKKNGGKGFGNGSSGGRMWGSGGGWYYGGGSGGLGGFGGGSGGLGGFGGFGGGSFGGGGASSRF